MEHANVWTGSQRKSTTRKSSSGNHLTIPSNDPQGFLRKFSFFNHAPEIPDDQGTGIQLPSTFCPEFHDRDAVAKLRFNYVGNTGMHFSALGLDTSSWGDRIKNEADESKATQAVHLALKLGINYIDTSPYDGEGRVESLLGKALSSVPRKAYYIGTKVGRYNPTSISEMFDYSAERVIRSVDESLARLRLPYVDILQIQDVQFAPNLEMILAETLPALEKIHSAGKARFLGITGYPLHTFKEIVEKSAVPIDAIRSHCRYGLFNRDLKDIIPELKENGVGIINAAPLGMGLLSSDGPDQKHPAPESLRRAAKDAVAYAKSEGEDLGKIALKYCYRVPGIATTLCNMERPEIVRACYETVIVPMTERETGVMHEVVKKFFIPLGRTHWENVEVTKYWEEMEKAGLVQPRMDLGDSYNIAGI